MPTPVEQWVEECAQLTHPKKIHWCDGSEAEYQSMIHHMLETGTLIELNQKEYQAAICTGAIPQTWHGPSTSPMCVRGSARMPDQTTTGWPRLKPKPRLERCLLGLCRVVRCTWCPTSWDR